VNDDKISCFLDDKRGYVMSGKLSYGTLTVRLRSGSNVPKHLYIKAHEGKGDEHSKGVALFVAGIPQQLTESRLYSLFEVFGTVNKARPPALQPSSSPCIDQCQEILILQVVVHPKRTSSIVLFHEACALTAALSAGRQGTVVELPEDKDDEGPSEGLRAMVEAHKARYPGNTVLQKQLDEWMEAFELEEERKRKEAEEAAAEDGWTVITKRAGRKRKQGVCQHL
jgi:ribosomal RNA-processing protein 7